MRWLSPFACGLTLLAGAGHAETLRVPSQYATIIAALDAAAYLDTVLVAPGVHSHAETRSVDLWNGPQDVTSVGFLQFGVFLASEGGPDVTTLDLSEGSGSTLAVLAAGRAASHATVQGFRFVVPENGVGIRADCSYGIDVRDCVFETGVPHGGWGLARNGGSSRVVDCTFDGLARAMNLYGCDLVLECCLVSDCSSEYGELYASPGPGAYDAALTIRDSVFRGNHWSW